MRKTSFLKQLYSCYFSKPVHDRLLYRTAAQFEFQSVVEIGISSIERTCRMLEIAHRYTDQPICYTGIDLFDARDGRQQQVGLKFAHVELKKTGAVVKLMPGDPFSSLSRCANLLSGTDLLIVGAEVDQQSMDRSWFYLPRMLHEESHVIIEHMKEDQVEFEESDLQSIIDRSESAMGTCSRPGLRKAA